jgi:hypothetical protein
MTTADALDRVIETITVDCYNEDEEYTAFLTVIEDEVALPAPASLLGTPVTVVQLDYADPARGLVVVCRGPDGTGEVALATWPFLPTRWLHGCMPPTATTLASGRSPLPRDPIGPGRRIDSPQMDRGGAAPVRLLVDGAFIVRQAAPSWTGRPW